MYDVQMHQIIIRKRYCVETVKVTPKQLNIENYAQQKR